MQIIFNSYKRNKLVNYFAFMETRLCCARFQCPNILCKNLYLFLEKQKIDIYLTKRFCDICQKLS